MSVIPKSAVEIEEEVAQIQRAQSDAQAFKPLYEKYYRKIYLFVYHRIGEKTLSADITSQVFLKALLNISKYKFKGLPFSSWLYRIALNESYDFMRKSSRVRFVSVDENTVEHLHDELTTETALSDLQAKLPSILEQLSIDELHMLELRFFEKRPFSEVADILGITENNAKVRVYRLLDRMRKLFLNLGGTV